MKVAAVVPTRNEADTIGPLVKRLGKFCDVVIVADDSTDGTYEVGSAGGAIVIEAPPGLGPSYLKAWELVPDDWAILHMDAGGSHDVADAYVAVDLVYMEQADIAIGSRFLSDSDYHGKRLRGFCSRRMADACNLLVTQHVHDWTSGLRCYSPVAREAITDHTFRTSGHAWQIEALWVALRGGCVAVETPIRYESSTSQLSTGRAIEAVKLLGWMAACR